MTDPSPLIDLFMRGEVARDVRLLAAQGALSPRALEQLTILVFLLEDPDPEIRTVAEQTLERIPIQTLRTFLARSDVPVDLREFFGDRGVFPSDTAPADDGDQPLIDVEPSNVADDEEEGNESINQKLADMSFTDRLKAAFKGTREMRSVLIRDPNKMIAAAVLSSPKLTTAEVESFARMTSVSDDVLRTIAHNRGWMKRYGVIAGLTKNPKTPVALSLRLVSRLNAKDLSTLAVDRNIPGALRNAARKRVAGATGDD
jgi:hypothetical protein